MQQLIAKIKEVEKSEINNIVEQSLKEFKSFKNKSDKDWFSELCFCILAANSKQKTAEAIEKSLGPDKLLAIEQKELAIFIRNNKHRFHNNKAQYIVEARGLYPIKEKIINLPESEARSWLIKNVMGLGYKEASHFLRNTGSLSLAILDRHILNLMEEHSLIQRPKTLTPKNYLEIEKVFRDIAKRLNVSSAKLDLMMWYLKTGEVLK